MVQKVAKTNACQLYRPTQYIYAYRVSAWRNVEGGQRRWPWLMCSPSCAETGWRTAPAASRGTAQSID
jgi:hypothetical protein